MLLPKPLSAAGLAAAAAAAPAAALSPAPEVTSTTAVAAGIRVTLGLRSLGDAGLRAYSRAQVEVQLRDTSSQSSPVTGRQPLLWLVKQEGVGTPDAEACKRTVRDILGGATALRPAAHFNHFELLTLDDHASVSILDPLLASTKTRMVGQVSLGGPAADIVASGRDAVVSLPDRGEVVRVLVEKRQSLSYAVGGHPYDLEILPGGALVVAGDVTGTSLALIDLSRSPTEADAVTYVTVGPGPHRLAASPSGELVAATTAGRQSVALINPVTRQVLSQTRLTSPTVSLAWSAAANALYVLGEDGVISRIRPGEPLARTAAKGRGVDLAASADGRWLAVLRDRPSVIEVLDTSTDTIVSSAAIAANPLRLLQAAAMVLAVHAGSAQAEGLDLAQFDPKRPAGVAQISLGSKGFPAGVLAPWIAEAPGGEGSFVLNPADRNVYQWMEGMVAPSASSALYPWTARGILASDQALREVEPGRYRTNGTLPAPGRYTAVMLARGTPQVLNCGAIDVAADLEQRDLRRVQAAITSPPGQAGIAGELRIRLTTLDHQPIDQVADLDVTVVQLPDFSEIVALRKVAPAGQGGRGADVAEFVGTVTPARAGPHQVMVRAPSLGIGAGRALAVRWEVTGQPLGAPPALAAAAAGPGVGTPAPVLPGLPDVTLLDQDGRKLRFVSDIIKGKIVFFNSFFTSCGGTCPVQSSVFAALQKRLGARVGKDIVLISVTVDPENDTPEALKAYAEKYGATAGWYFLTGDEKDVQKVLEAMDLYTQRPDDHSPMAAVGHEPTMLWRKVLNLKAPAALQAELKLLEQDVAHRTTSQGKPVP